jgi:hypothetical protein
MGTWRRKGEPGSSSLTAQGLIGLMGLFFGLCAIFAAIVSAAEGWREHAQARWPETTARIQECSVDPYEPLRGPRVVWHIECRIAYALGFEEVVAKIRSRSVPEGKSVALMHQWVAEHPPQCSIVVRYDPSDHKNAVLTTTDMPYAGPRTPSNLRLLVIFTLGSVVLITIARRMGKRPDPVRAQ